MLQPPGHVLHTASDQSDSTDAECHASSFAHLVLMANKFNLSRMKPVSPAGNVPVVMMTLSQSI